MAPSTDQYLVEVPEIGPVEVTVSQVGDGRPTLLLHGGGGPQTVASFAALLSVEGNMKVISPTHPGFGATPRPENLSTVKGLAALYVGLLEQLELQDVTVIGNSIGGWIAAEIGLLGSPRVGRVVLVGAVGIKIPGQQIVDFFSLDMAQVAKLSYHDPEKFQINLDSLPEDVRAVIAGNRKSLALYSGGPEMNDPDLSERLGAMSAPVLALWGESDQIVGPEYGRAFVSAVPDGQFVLLSHTGHLPQLETPDQLADAILEFTSRTEARS